MSLLILTCQLIISVFTSSVYDSIFEKFNLSLKDKPKIAESDDDFVYLHFLKNTIYHQQLESASNLLISSFESKNNYTIKDLLLISNNLVKLPEEDRWNISTEIANVSINNFLTNYQFEYPIIRLRELFRSKKSNDALFGMLTEIESDFTNHQNTFKRLFMKGSIDLTKCLNYLKNIKDPKAVALIGEMYLHGLGVEKDLDKAMDCFWIGNLTPETSMSSLNLGKVLESDRFNDTSGAIKAYKKSLNHGENVIESMVRLYLLTENKDYLIRLFDGFRHPIVDLVCIKYLLDDFEINEDLFQMFIKGIILFHPTIQKHIMDACLAYEKKNYTKSFLLFLFLSEFNFKSGKIAAFEILLLSFDSIKLNKNFKNRLFFNMAYDLKDASPRFTYFLGECYRLGLGTKKSNAKAISCYYACKKSSPYAYLRLIKMCLSEELVNGDLNYAVKLLNESNFNTTFYYFMYLKIYCKSFIKNIWFSLLNYKVVFIVIIAAIVIIITLLDEFSLI